VIRPDAEQHPAQHRTIPATRDKGGPRWGLFSNVVPKSGIAPNIGSTSRTISNQDGISASVAAMTRMRSIMPRRPADSDAGPPCTNRPPIAATVATRSTRGPRLGLLAYLSSSTRGNDLLRRGGMT
jgi:hypothetical protein